MSRKRFAFRNHKGGVGKSMSCVHVAGELARRGNRVLIVDTDTQNHSGKWLGVPKSPGLYSLLVDQVKVADVAVPIQPFTYDPFIKTEMDFTIPAVVAASRLWVIPSDNKTEVILRLTKKPNGLKHRLMEIEAQFDYILMDTSPTSTELEVSVLLASQGFVYVTDCDFLSIDGLVDTMQQLDEDDLSEDRFLGIIPNHFERTTEARERLENLKGAFGDRVWPEVPQRTAIKKSPGHGRTLYTYDPENDAVRVLRSIVDRFQEAAAL